jgi:hypothetical protein
MDKAVVQGDIDRLRREMPRHELVQRVCLVLERYLVRDRRSGVFDRRAYMRDYMRMRRAEDKRRGKGGKR